MQHPTPAPNYGLEIPQAGGSQESGGLLGMLLKMLIKAVIPALEQEEDGEDPANNLQDAFRERNNAAGTGAKPPQNDPFTPGGFDASGSREESNSDDDLAELLAQFRKRRIGKRSARAYIAGGGGGHIRQGPGL